MAVLLERAFPEFKDSLLTTVELADDESPQQLSGVKPTDTEVAETRAMLQETTAMAESQIGDVDIGRVFRQAPLIRRIASATLLVVFDPSDGHICAGRISDLDKSALFVVRTTLASASGNRTRWF